VRSQEVLLPISVRDGSGGAVNGLGREAFLVFDNGVRQELTSFNRRRVPAKIVLLLDASGSVFSQMRLIREAAVRFAQGLLKEDELCVMQFADRVELLLDWTPATELGQVEKSLNWRYHAGLRTTFYDGLYLAAEEQLRKVEGRRIIILLTDGLDTAERQKASLADALNAVRRAEASVYVVSLTASLRAEVERKAGSGGKRILLGGYDPREVNAYLKMLDQSEAQLANLAAQTGGRIFLPVTDAGLSPAYQAIAEELRTQYIVTYRPRPQVAAGEYRRIRVLVLPGGYEVGAREGYLGRE
jgi:Ca-activated chloride channel family protein